MNEITILGTGSGMGCPSFCCDCEGCEEAVRNPKAARTRCGVHVATNGNSILVDTPPDLRSQLIREGIKTVDTIFYTHWHWDHFGGIGELEYYVKLHRKEPLDVHLLSDAYDKLQVQFPNMCDIMTLMPLSFGERIKVGDIAFTPYEAVHGHTQTAGYLIESANVRVAYFPDVASLSNATVEKIKGVDYFICDCSFFGENTFPASHMNMTQAVALARKVEAKKTILTHHSIHYSDVKTIETMEAAVASHSGVVLAFDGMKLSL